MDSYQIVKTLHIISATILFGTGMGIAFFMFCSHYAKNISERYFAARFTVLADYIFTLPAVIIQPATGFWLLWTGGYDPFGLWLVITYALYILAGICWLPVVWLQIEMKKIVANCLEQDQPLPVRYHNLFRIWFLLGWPAFASLMVIFAMMVIKPV